MHAQQGPAECLRGSLQAISWESIHTSTPSSSSSSSHIRETEQDQVMKRQPEVAAALYLLVSIGIAASFQQPLLTTWICSPSSLTDKRTSTVMKEVLPTSSPEEGSADRRHHLQSLLSLVTGAAALTGSAPWAQAVGNDEYEVRLL